MKKKEQEKEKIFYTAEELVESCRQKTLFTCSIFLEEKIKSNKFVETKINVCHTGIFVEIHGRRENNKGLCYQFEKLSFPFYEKNLLQLIEIAKKYQDVFTTASKLINKLKIK